MTEELNWVLTDSEDDTEDVCRICYIGRNHEELIKPCRCSGSLAYVHPSCLDSWVENSGSPRCEICYGNYPLSINFKWWRIWNDIWIKYIIRQEPIFVFISALVNILSSVIFRPDYFKGHIEQLIEELMIFVCLTLFILTMAVTGVLLRNLLRYFIWQWEMHYFPHVLREEPYNQHN